jgi:hypothetical protein
VSTVTTWALSHGFTPYETWMLAAPVSLVVASPL